MRPTALRQSDVCLGLRAASTLPNHLHRLALVQYLTAVDAI